jgi:DNA-binding SARP family transcriptional activator/tetratricopeptide (TPR) repeat protein/transcriptional regulator with XRE-family HTH domain
MFSIFRESDAAFFRVGGTRVSKGYGGDSAFGKQVAQLRGAAGFTQTELARRAGVSVASIRDLEQGRVTRPHSESVRRIAAALGIELRSREARLDKGRQEDRGPEEDRGQEEDLVPEEGRGPEENRGQEEDRGQEENRGQEKDRGQEKGTSPAGGSGLRVGICGPLTVSRDGAESGALPAGQRLVVGLLALAAGSAILPGSIIAALWPEQDPPASAATIVRTYVSRLRSRFGVEGERLISRGNGGYRLCLSAEQLDLLAFRRLVGLAREAEDSRRACEWYEQAMCLWRGDPVEDIELLRAHPAAVALAGERIAVVLEYADRAAVAGRHDMVLPHIKALTAANPLDERLHAALMVALAGSGRQAEALRVYDDLRCRLAEELGMDPGEQLRDAHQKVLRQEITAGVAIAASASMATPHHPGSAAPAPVVPRQLLAAPERFVGREAELSVLSGLSQAARGTVVISTVGGMPGVGKTALALHWAHQVAGEFPDGQLYVNLRGFDPSGAVAPGQALGWFLEALGVAAEATPVSQEARAALYRSLVAGRRLLIVLDNARDADQARLLLPGSPGCLVLVTSRSQLTGLAASVGARLITLDVLSPAEARQMLTDRIGADRAAAEPAAVSDIANLCAFLPLALAVAAARAAARPGVPLAALADELRSTATRMDALDAGDPSASVRAVFSWSTRQLSPGGARMFRLLGLHPGPDVELYAAAALTGTTVPQTRQALDGLARANLIQPAAAGRYGMHDLLRGYARELSARDGEEDQDAALTRLFDHYLYTAAAAMDTLFPAELRYRPRIPCPATPVPPLADPTAAREWLDRERAGLVAAAGHTAAGAWPGHAIRLAATLSRYLLNGDHGPEALTIFNHALGAARRTGDRTAEAAALTDISIMDWQQSRFQQAVDGYLQALALFSEAGDRAGEARVLGNLGLAEKDLGRYEEAAQHQQEALAILRELGDRFREGRALGYLGLILGRQGRHEEARGYHQKTLDLSREIGDRVGEAWALQWLGVVDLRLGRYQSAAGYLQHALALFQEMDIKSGEALNLVKFGELYVASGRYEQAAGNFEQAVVMSRELADTVLEGEALIGLGDVQLRTGDAGEARAHYAAALRLASEADAPLEQARAHRALARACQASGDASQARHHWREALTRYAIGDPEADQVRAEMATADHDQAPQS